MCVCVCACASVSTHFAAKIPIDRSGNLFVSLRETIRDNERRLENVGDYRRPWEPMHIAFDMYFKRLMLVLLYLVCATPPKYFFFKRMFVNF